MTLPKDWRVQRALKSVGLRKNTRQFGGETFTLDHVAMLKKTLPQSRKTLKAKGFSVRTTKTGMDHYAVWKRKRS